jgi:hypothetical protein
LITLAITLLRLLGELLHWSPRFFSPAAGGGLAVIGISWLPPVLGVYFAFKLTKAGERPQRTIIGIVMAVVGFFAIFAGAYVAFASPNKSLVRLVLGLLIIALAGAVQYLGWPRLFKVLLAYAYAARIPVAIVMFFAIMGDWGTHYDVLPPNSPPIPSFWTKYITIGLIPQLLLWITFTLSTGSLFGLIFGAIFARRKSTAGMGAAPTLART